MTFLHQQFLYQLIINITIRAVTVGCRIIDEISNSLYSPSGDSRVQNVQVTVKKREVSCHFHYVNLEASLRKTWM